MTLRQRIVLSLALIALILVAPAVYGLFALRALEHVARQLRTRDAVGALALGRLQTALGEVEHWQRVYLALGQAEAREAVATAMREVDAELHRLSESGYRAPAGLALEQWVWLRAAITEEQRLVERGAVDAADQYRIRSVAPGFSALNRALEPIGRAINQAGEAEVERAQTIARRAVTTTLLALAATLSLALLIGGWLTRTLLRPIHELRQGMAVVAEGDFEPQVQIPPQRRDELGDLARSFERMTEQLAELDRLKAEFVSVASHELKTPLSVIRGYVSLLLDGIYGEVPEKQRAVLGSVSEQADRLTRLVQRLLDVSRFEAGGGRLELRSVALRPFIDELTTSFEALALQNEIDFRLRAAPDLPESVVADADRLNEVLGNLLSNAFKFTPRGGRIELELQRADHGVSVMVRDSGVGIPADKLPRIFEKFYQVDNAAQPRSVGSGLGLAIAREIMEAHGGTITAESQVGRGTTFRLFLPQQPPVANAA